MQLPFCKHIQTPIYIPALKFWSLRLNFLQLIELEVVLKKMQPHHDHYFHHLDFRLVRKTQTSKKIDPLIELQCQHTVRTQEVTVRLLRYSSSNKI